MRYPVPSLRSQGSVADSAVALTLHAGIMWPLINDQKAGIWFDKKFGQGNSDIRGIYAYKVFTGLGFILGDGAYNLVLLIFTTVYHL